MKRFIWQSTIAALFAILFYGCGPTADDIMKKYEKFNVMQQDTAKSRVSISISEGTPTIGYSLPLLNTNEEYMKILAKRWFVADAENPFIRFPAEAGVIKNTNNTDQSVIYEHTLFIGSIKERFLIIGFEGIDSRESEAVAIPPLFFIAENNKGVCKMLSDKPLLAGDLFIPSYVPTHFVTYSTLTIQKINLQTDAFMNISFKSLVVTDEKGVEITVKDLDKWFENAELKKATINGSMEITFGSEGANKVSMGKDANLHCEFKVDDKVYGYNFVVGMELLTEKTVEGKYILLPEKGGKLLK